MILTGGTIAMDPTGLETPPPPIGKKGGKQNPQALTIAPGFAKKLLKALPELASLAELGVCSLFEKDSTVVTPADWITIAETIGRFYDDYDGFVVIHGTDTMTYAATAVSYMLPFPCKPVIFTGSLRPLGAVLTDARRNLVSSVLLAAEQRILETCIFFDTKLYRANRTIKSHIEDFDGFSSPNFPILAEQRLHTKYFDVPRHVCDHPKLKVAFSGDLQVIYPYPGMAMALNPKARALLVLGFGCGNLPSTNKDMVALLKECRRKSVPVLLASQVPAGAATPELYEMGRWAVEMGAISTGDMTTAAAIVKAQVILANRAPLEHWGQLMAQNWAGEITPAAML